MSIERTEGLILKTYDYSETSKIAVVFTKHFGKIKVIAKGAKSKNSKTAAILDPGSYVKLIFYLKHDSELFNVSEASVIDQFSPIRLDLTKFAYYMYLLELVDALFEHEEGVHGLFDVLIAHIRQFAAGGNPVLVVRALEIKILAILGHMLELTKCVGCGKEIPPDMLPRRLPDAHLKTGKKMFYLSLHQGGILCKRCAPADKRRTTCSHAFVRIFEFLASSEPEEIAYLEVSRSQMDELKNILRNTLDFLLGKSLKSLSFLDQVLGEKSPGITHTPRR
jgi:DNA repair protein RecO (recombination protein O)